MNEQVTLLEHVKEDLDKALKIEIEDIIVDTNGVREGQTIWKNQGSVRKYFTLIEDPCVQGAPVLWSVHYTSNGGTVMWLRTSFDRQTWKHVIDDGYDEYPP